MKQEVEVFKKQEVLKDEYFELTATSLTMKPGTPQEVWLKAMDVICEGESIWKWWLGDALVAGKRAFGEEGLKKIPVGKLSKASEKQYKYIARHVAKSVRIYPLSFSHYAKVASLEAEDQHRWLSLAVKGHWSVETLREAIWEEKRRSREEKGKPSGKGEIIELVIVEMVKRLRNAVYSEVMRMCHLLSPEGKWQPGRIGRETGDFPTWGRISQKVEDVARKTHECLAYAAKTELPRNRYHKIYRLWKYREKIDRGVLFWYWSGCIVGSIREDREVDGHECIGAHGLVVESERKHTHHSLSGPNWVAFGRCGFTELCQSAREELSHIPGSELFEGEKAWRICFYKNHLAYPSTEYLEEGDKPECKWCLHRKRCWKIKKLFEGIIGDQQ